MVVEGLGLVILYLVLVFFGEFVWREIVRVFARVALNLS